jgi:hypothetical protein
MNGKIYLIDENEQIQGTMSEIPFKDELQLQRAIELQPDLIPGDQIDPENPRRWILIDKEAGIPDVAGSGDRWFLDHLLVDQDAIPTLVECKNSGNSELRRKVVAQMLDYAANIRVHWPHGRARELAEKSLIKNDLDISSATFSLTGDSDLDKVDQFWERVDENLDEGRIRLVFAAPRIPRELQTIVDFLNGQMTTTDVVAVEIKLFKGESGLSAFVPRVTGRSAYGRVARSNQPRSTLPVETLLTSIESESFRNNIESITLAVEQIGALPKPGSVGASWRIQLSQLMTLCWLFPSGRGWMGMRDFTIGIVKDRLSELEENERTSLENFGTSISHLAGEGFDKDWFIGNQFSEATLAENLEEIKKLIVDLGDELRR